ncbi:hypothetical protein KY289_000499 [Solanum tuberosum]|nr:hypothetical protein KY289_000499 [Solanum tuberosum]
MDIDEIDAMDEIDIDKDLNFFDESNVSSFINGNFKMKMVAGSFYIPKSNKAPHGKMHIRLVRNVELSIHKQKDQNNKIQSMEVLNEAYFKHEMSRDRIIVFKSDIKKKGFNSPFQLGNVVKFDDPSVAQEIKVTVRTWDVIMMSTDGLFDSVHDAELEKLVHNGLVDLCELGTFSKMLARKIAEYALQK